MRRLKHVNAAGLLLLVIAFVMTGFFMLSFSTQTFDFLALLFAIVIGTVMLAEYAIMLRISKHADRFVMIVSDMLIGVGLLIQYRLDVENAFRQLLFLLAGIVCMFVVMAIMKNTNFFQRISWLLMAVSIVILGALLFIGKEVGGAKNWITIGSVQFQPSEFVKLAMVLVLADWLTDRHRIGDLAVPILFVIIVVGILMLEKDLGAVILLFGTALILFYVATGRKLPVMFGLGIGAAGAVASYHLFDHVKARVAIWINPWATYYTNGFQIAQGLMAIATGGMWGVGLGVGSPKLIPEYNTDYIFAVICEEFGILFGITL
ncbi:MAG: FtsW/RodA/SpoVE family cell cycle protein, partial [Clostridia bacterium]|nr:FtsW/RodA/SpoVE family cell cycle protein [Clostridia bacterium]